MSRNKRTIALIKMYQRNKRISGRCRFLPTCSNYAIEAYQKFNWFYASILTGLRILRCNPLTKRRIDPVPLNKEEKRKLKLINNLKTNFDMVYIDTILKYPSLSKEDYKQLTLEYLFGQHQNQPNVCFDDLEFIGLNYVRTNYYKEYNTTIEQNKLDEYLNILEILANNNIISYQESNLLPSYNVVKSTDLPFDYYFKKIDKFLADKTYIGIDGDIPKELIDKYHPVIITSQELNHKFIHTNNDEIVFVCGNDITNSKKSFYLNCLIKIYQDNETFDINKYNIIIPNNIKRG